MKKIFLQAMLTLLSISIASAQNTTSTNSASLLLQLQKLNTIGSVLYVAAHPDDENTRLLGYLSNEKKLRTGYISITRGDGGQNLIGKEQGELLGLIRTQELLAARKTDGAEQFFTRANDFGYSKNPEETFAIWNKDSILKDLVWVIRKFKPDVIICRFPTTGEGGHGHHTASALLAVEAFDAAADPKKYPEQLLNVTTWQAKRIFWNTFNFGGNNTTAEDQLKLDVGVYNPLLGKGYGEIAAESRSMHKSQGFGSAKTRGTSIEYFKQLKGDIVTKDLFEGINQSWKRLSGTEKIQTLIDGCINKFNPLKPELSVQDLVAIYKEIQQLKETDANIIYWKQQKLMETESLLLGCAGVWLEASAGDFNGIPGDTVNITAQIINRNGADIKLSKINFLQQTDTSTSLELKPNELFTFKHKERLSENQSYSNPYWLNEKHTEGLFVIRNPLLIGNPENKPATTVSFFLIINGLPLQIEKPLIYKSTDPVKGEVYRNFEILPPATINIAEKVYVFSDAKPKTVQFIIKANADNVSGTMSISVPENWILSTSNNKFNLLKKGDEAILEASISKGSSNGVAKLTASLNINNKVYSKSIQRIEYDHIPYQFTLSEAEVKLVNVDVKKGMNTIGYIAGAGDEIPACLNQLGYDVTVLTDEMIGSENLTRYAAIVTGIRAYNTNSRLQLHYDKLMDYIKQGGNLIVQYNTNSRVGPMQPKIGPYPFTISRDRVTDEKAEIRFINTEHSALNYPNKITANDFDGWIQERGIYFATDLDKNYETILSSNDPTEKASDGGIIISKYGKGNFVYTGMAFFRQLPAGVPGAYRLFVNLISLPANK